MTKSSKEKKEESSSSFTFKLYDIYDFDDENYLFTKKDKEKLKSEDNRKQKKNL